MTFLHSVLVRLVVGIKKPPNQAVFQVLRVRATMAAVRRATSNAL